MIAFKQDTQLEVVISFDEKHDTIAEQAQETFKAGEPVDAEIISENGEFVDLQYGDGTVSIGVQRDSFDVIDA
jgi:hypothetical protein